MLEKKNMIVITIITEYFNQYVLELLKNREVFNFLVGYILGIVSILFYLKVNYFLKKKYSIVILFYIIRLKKKVE